MSRCALSVLDLSLLIATAAAAEAPTAPPVVTSKIELVRVDAVVLDENRRPVRGLTRADFEVLENGKPREIASFEAIEVWDGLRRSGEAAVGPVEAAPGMPAAAGGSAPGLPDAPVMPASESAPRVLQPAEGRALLVYFDQFHVQDANAELLRRRLIPLLSRELRPGDALTLVAPQANLWWTARTPYEHAQLPKVIERLRGQYDPDPFRDRTSDWARSIEYGKDLVLAMQEMATKQNADVVEQRIRRTLNGLQRAIESLASFRGRKSLVLFSEGFVLGPWREPYERVIDLCRRANVAVYFGDPRGLQAGGSVASAADSSSNFSGSGARASTHIEGERAGAVHIALATGGEVFDSNEVSEVVERVLEESRSYYLIGFEPAAGPDGERKLELRVRGRKLTVRARNRYIAGRTKDRFDDPAAIRAARELSDRAGVPIRVSTVPGDALGTVQLNVTLEPVQPERERRIELLVERRPLARGEIVQDTATITLPPSDGDQNVVHHLSLAPGVWQLRVVATDVGSGAMGSALHTFEVPAR